jgi:hypothetical protein
MVDILKPDASGSTEHFPFQIAVEVHTFIQYAKQAVEDFGRDDKGPFVVCGTSRLKCLKSAEVASFFQLMYQSGYAVIWNNPNPCTRCASEMLFSRIMCPKDVSSNSTNRGN